jgi:phosphoenolpyruvate synthase/pyruvate phosphate dikinase
MYKEDPNEFVIRNGTENLSLLLLNDNFVGLPVTIRLLDPPLHEFLPEGDIEEIVAELAAETGSGEEEILSRIEKLSEVNPMLGFRGCRYKRSLTFTDQEIYCYPNT